MSKQEIEEILAFYHNSSTQDLARRADTVCRMNYGNAVYLRGLIEFSNHCHSDCLYCGIRKSNNKVVRYRMSKEEILDAVRMGKDCGLKSFVLQSGEDSFYTCDLLCDIIQAIKEITQGQAAVTLSCGIRSKQQYAQWKAVGADRYLMRFETSDPDLHERLRHGISLKRRLQALEDLKECGYELGSGYMVGLPGETEEMRVNNALLCHKLQLDMVGIGPFIPNQDTPLAGQGGGSIEMTIRAVSLVRLLLPKANIPATTAAGSIDPQGREKILQAGANVLMPNITPVLQKKNYLLYPDKICLDEDGLKCLNCLKYRVLSINKSISLERGDSLGIGMKNGLCE